MVIDLKMCRFENAPWGFRLVGGSDYEYPLTVVKVTPESIAEKAGIQIGDVIVRINDIAASSLSHNEAHDIILNCGNTFFFGIKRESEEEIQPDQYDQEIEVTLPRPEIKENSENNTVSLNVKIKSPALQKQTAVEEEDQLEQEIAEILTEEKEVLKDHNVIGIFPKPGVCMSSKVLRQLNEDAIKTKEEILKEQRRWTTFMQKPDRPIPKSKAELEVEKLRQDNPYKVVIRKQPKPKVAPDRVPTPPWKEVIPEPEPENTELQSEPEIEEPSITDTEVPDLTPLTNGENCDQAFQDDYQVSYDEEHKNENQESNLEDNENEHELNEDENERNKETPEKESKLLEIQQKTEDELQLERQLAEVQQQLLALSNLPTTIQATLDAVTKQLAELLPAIKKHSPVDINQVPDKIEKFHLDDQLKKDLKTIEEEQEEITEETAVDESNEMQQEEGKNEEETIQQLEFNENENQPLSETYDYKNIKEVELTEAELETIKRDTELIKAKKEETLFKKQKENGLIEELQQRIKSLDHIDGENCAGGGNKKKRSRLFGPLVPSTRPLILPGGRRWRTPKDAFNEEFIAEVLSSQAELISGSAVGVNFMKYQKPEKKVDLDKSEVFKILHNLDKRPKHGIEVRAPIVPAEEDIRNLAASC